MRLLLLALALSLILLQARLWISEEGMREVWRLEEQVAQRTQENRILAANNAAQMRESFMGFLPISRSRQVSPV